MDNILQEKRRREISLKCATDLLVPLVPVFANPEKMYQRLIETAQRMEIYLETGEDWKPKESEVNHESIDSL
tara:strand:- start:197 stop:412 length:216 start_codon:yes stop_codon:yes gene_type:complete